MSESTSQASFSLAGFQVTIIGRFWVTTEVDLPRAQHVHPDIPALQFVEPRACE
jgi:hypothetical protein